MNNVINFFIKQRFCLLFFLGFHKKHIDFNIDFTSNDLSDGQWEADITTCHYTKLYRQGCGIIQYQAILNGEFRDDLWPALWMLDVNGHEYNLYYSEIDIELWHKGQVNPYLVCTSWFNDLNGSSLKEDGCKSQSFKLKNKTLIKRLQSEVHEYTIDWDKKQIKYYIDGILIGKLTNSPFGNMTLAVWDAGIDKVIAGEKYI